MTVSINTAGAYTVTRLSNADASTGWTQNTISGSGGSVSGAPSGAVGSTDLVVEGADARETRTNRQRVEMYFTLTAGVDFTSGSTGTGANKQPNGNFYAWSSFLAAGSLLTQANGGYQIRLGDGTNVSYWNVAGSDSYTGGYVKWAVNTGIAPDENSGSNANLGDITTFGVVTDVGGATTRFQNFLVDAIDYGDGLDFQGTTTTDSLFSESFSQDNTTKIGVLSEENGIIFSQGSVAFSGTAQTSISETLVFTDTLQGAVTYNIDITGTVVFTNSQVSASGAVDYIFDSSAATSFTMNGGGLLNFNTVTFGAGQTVDGVLLQAGGSISIPNTVNASTINQCGQVSFTGSGQLTDSTVNSSTATSAVLLSDLSVVTGNNFIGDGTGHAVELTSLGSGSMTWDNTFNSSTYAAVDGSTGNEVLFVNVGSGTLTINVASGANAPTIRTAGATVNVIAGAVTIRVIAADIGGAAVENARVYLTKVAGGAVVLNGLSNANGIVEDTTYTYTTDEAVTGWIRKSSATDNPRYKQAPLSGTITSTGFSTTGVLISDE